MSAQTPSPTNEIIICMGSSCFSRGNNTTLALIQQYLHSRGLSETIELKGVLCAGNCKAGPHVSVAGTPYQGITPTAIIDILDHHFGPAAPSQHD
jgi:NADH:ubiquinone oxidoreductase subunit E